MGSNIVGAVLAGGASERMGAPKGNLRLGSQTYLERIVSTMLGIFDMVYVCGGDTAVLGSTLVHDPMPHAGPLGGVVSALREAHPGTAFITAVDFPLISRATILRLVERPVAVDQARIARVDGWPQPLCGAYGADLMDLAGRHLRSTDRSVMGLASDVPHLELVDIDDGSLRNINTPEDHRALLADLS
jgi:molybdenum cofactor guanylyltransferase